MKVEKYYVSEDGRRFDTKKDCLDYEKSFNNFKDFNKMVESACYLLNKLGVKCFYSTETDENCASLHIEDIESDKRLLIVFPCWRESKNEATLWFKN